VEQLQYHQVLQLPLLHLELQMLMILLFQAWQVLPLTQFVLFHDSHKKLIAHFDTGTNIPVTPNGGDITIQWSDAANKIFKL